MSPRAWRPVIDRFSKLKTLVIGDLMLDHYIWGTVSRNSPEAPVPVVEVARGTEMPGGAGNVALNMASLGSEVLLLGTLGHDGSADRFLSRFDHLRVNTASIVRASDRPTTVK